MGQPSLDTRPPVNTPEVRLDSWKEIAAYLHRDVTTAQRWEKREGMPVHRHQHDRMGSVYAFSSELDTWVQGRRLRLETAKKEELPDALVGAEIERGPSHPFWPRRRLALRIALSGIALLGALALIYVVTRTRPGASVHPKITSLAVLPLKNLSGDPNQEYLADGMTEALIARLSQIHNLRVISRTSVMRFKDPQLPAPEIAKILKVDALVEGSVIREGDRIRVNAQLIRGATDEHFWSEAYDRQLQDALALQSDVAQSIARRVEVTVSGQERNRLLAARHVSPEVYENYLKGEFALDKSNSKAGIEHSLAYFDKAIQEDPTFAPAYLGRAEGYIELGTAFVGTRPGDVRPKVISSAQRALELDPQLSKAYLLLADVHEEQWQWAEAESEYRRALELDPNSSAAQGGYAIWLVCQGRAEEAVAWAQQAREHDPLALSGIRMGWILFQTRHYAEAIQELRSAVAVSPDNAGALWFLGFALIANGQSQEAIPVLEKVLSVSDRSAATIGVLIRAYANAGRRPDALGLLEELKTRSQKGYVPSAAFVNAYLGLGDNEEAFVWLERACEEKSNILQWVKVHPFFDPLRGDPRFAEIVHRVGLS